MNHQSQNITFQAGRYIAELFNDKLSPDMVFHNFHHTSNVVRGVCDIGQHLGIAEENLEVLILAAWFHDSGHTIQYQNHEQMSIAIAKAWLKKKRYPATKIDAITSCITATMLPQNPKTRLEEIICDADLYHLGLPEYYHLQSLLREELRRVFKKQYTDLEWMEENVLFLHKHQYFTPYGQNILANRKHSNVQLCESILAEYKH